MAQTPNSNASSYLSAAQFLKRCDTRLLADIVSITGERDESSLATNEMLLAALLDASGDVEAACLKGERYQPADLAALTGASQGKLFRIITRLAIGYLWENRLEDLPISHGYEAALNDLDHLAEGDRIFSTLEAQDAGLPTSTVETATEIYDRSGVVVQAQRYFGVRANRRDPRYQ